LDAISTCIDNVFAAFPRTERALELNQEALTGM